MSKAKFMFLCTQPRLNELWNYSLMMNGIELESVHLFKYLHIHLDDCLTFNTSTTLMLYKSLVLLYFDYGNDIYSGTSKAVLDRLQLLQNNACKAIC